MNYRWIPRVPLDFALSVFGVAVTLLLFAGSQSVNGAPSGEDTFKANCATCHAGGGNVVDPKKPLRGSAKLASKDAFKTYLLKAAGAMPAFPKIANDAPTMEALYNYCKTFK